jgi:dTDP-4-amino-4,6-dideoxygalactose transaminase
MGPQHLQAALERARGHRVKAVLPVHLAGQAVDMPGIHGVARDAGLAVIEDACHALGTVGADAPGGGRPWTVGDCTYSQLTAFSLHPVKTITSGEGGVTTTNNAALAQRMRLLRSHGMIRNPADFLDRQQGLDGDGRANPWYSEMHEVGFNYRLSDLNCGLGLSQLRKLPRFIARRLELAARYDRLLAPLAPRVRPIARAPGCRPGLHLYVVHIDFAGCGVSRAQLMNRLRDRGIGTQVHYLPLNHQPYFVRRYGPQATPGADAYYAGALSLPLFPAMSDGDADRVAEALAQCLGL